VIDLKRDGNVFTLVMDEGENRWNTRFVRILAEAIAEVEGSEGPAALVTTSANPKFFSNGLDLDWVRGIGHSSCILAQRPSMGVMLNP
jgi:Delta3-Delta2-enoyl-CoA isomerase